MCDIEKLSNTKKKNIDRAIRQLERGFKILADNKCSVFFEAGGIHVFPTEKLPFTPKGSPDQEVIIDEVICNCDFDAGAW